LWLTFIKAAPAPVTGYSVNEVQPNLRSDTLAELEALADRSSELSLVFARSVSEKPDKIIIRLKNTSIQAKYILNLPVAWLLEMIRSKAAINTIIPAREPVIKIEAPKISVKMTFESLVNFKMGKKHKGKVRQTEIANALG